MRYASRRAGRFAKADMTPMIDMTFQLIAFFMVVVNFSEADQDQRIKLPSSELAKPPEAAAESLLTIQVTKSGTAIFGGHETVVSDIRPLLMNERNIINATPNRSAEKTTVIIRADRAAKTGKVQEVIKICQEVGFEKFAVRAKQQQMGM